MEPKLVKVGSVDEIRSAGRKVVGVGGRPVLVLALGEAFHAIDNRCPHMGFPLSRGDVHDGILDCHWHHARFDVTCGATLDPWADDADSFPVVVEGGVVYVDPRRPPRDEVAHGLARLDRGLDDDLRLVIAKAAIGLDAAGAGERAAAAGARFGATRREGGWPVGLSILAAVRNVSPALAATDRPRALVAALAHVASECAGEPPRRPLRALAGTARSREGLVEWLRETVEVRDADGAERVLRTIVERHGPAAALSAVLVVTTDHRYSDQGHVLDYAVKCAELVEDLRVSPEGAALLFTSLAPRLAEMERMEESSGWRRPIDVAAIAAEAARDLPAAAFGAPADDVLPDEAALVEILLGDDPRAAAACLADRLRAGASPIALAEAVLTAAVERQLAFGTANEISDWDTVHHTTTFANAVAEGMRRAPSPKLFRGVLDGAMSLYLDRFLNIPPARPLERNGAQPGDTADELRAALLEAFDRRGSVDEATKLAARFLAAGGRPDELLATLGTAVLREDAGFHDYQQLEIAWRRLARRGPGAAAGRALCATARFLAARFPTPRAREQTFRIASRLTRGEPLHEVEAGDSA